MQNLNTIRQQFRSKRLDLLLNISLTAKRPDQVIAFKFLFN
jgi:hypothetical protein